MGDDRRPKVLVLAQYYLPSRNAGGGLRTIVNMIDRLSDRFDFRVVTTDRDLGDLRPYPDVRTGDWSRVGGAEVFYGSNSRLGLIGLARLLRTVQPDAVYLNSFFSPLATRYLLLRRIGLAGRARAILAPEGELAPDALRHKRFKKQAWWAVANSLGLYAGLLWKAAAPHEAATIRRLVYRAREVRIAPNMPPLPEAIVRPAGAGKDAKVAGEVKLIFLARVVPIKNLAWALQAVSSVDGRLILDVYGPLEDKTYWASCSELISELPSNISVTYRGVLAADAVAETFARYHFMVLPTVGENFGHVIIESLAAGCPVIISDRTPWRGLIPKGIGWDLPLNDLGPWSDVLNRCAGMGAAEYMAMSERARRYAIDWLLSPDVERDTADVLREAVSSRE